MHPVRRQGEILGNDNLDPVGIDIGGDGGVHVFGNRLECHPATAVARQFPAEHAQVQHFLHIGGAQHRHRGADKHMLRLVRQGGGLAGVVIPRHRQHPAVSGGAEGIGVLDHIHAAIHPRPLAVPHAEHAIVAGAGKQVGLLAAPHRGGGQILVHPGLEVHIVLVQPGFGLPHGLVHAAHGGAAITGDKGSGIEPALQVPLVLQHRQAHQRLDAGHVGPGRIQRVLVVQRNLFISARDMICCHGVHPSGFGASCCRNSWKLLFDFSPCRTKSE